MRPSPYFSSGRPLDQADSTVWRTTLALAQGQHCAGWMDGKILCLYASPLYSTKGTFVQGLPQFHNSTIPQSSQFRPSTASHVGAPLCRAHGHFISIELCLGRASFPFCQPDNHQVKSPPKGGGGLVAFFTSCVCCTRLPLSLLEYGRGLAFSVFVLRSWTGNSPRLPSFLGHT